ncbi:MAG: hypothetical protein L0206_13975 [Actinobacteria bacterium]|nr:hypothetical protein [Actinomycetota bacterium]
MVRSTLVLVVALVLVACARQDPNGPGSGGDPTGPDPIRVQIYTEAFRALAETESWYDPVLLDERICPDVAEVTVIDPKPCEERFTEAEQAAILASLTGLPNLRFVGDFELIRDRIFADELQGAGLLTVGPIEGDGDRARVDARSYCGSLCAHWMTFVIQEGPEGWEVTGTTGPVAVS